MLLGHYQKYGCLISTFRDTEKIVCRLSLRSLKFSWRWVLTIGLAIHFSIVMTNSMIAGRIDWVNRHEGYSC